MRMLLATEGQSAFELPDASVDGNGVRDDVADGSWAAILEEATRGGAERDRHRH
jgi:hypothetical protein